MQDGCGPELVFWNEETGRWEKDHDKIQELLIDLHREVYRRVDVFKAGLLAAAKEREIELHAEALRQLEIKRSELK